MKKKMISDLDKNLINKVREFVIKNGHQSVIHGIEHWDRVFANGQRLLSDDADALVVGLFAYLHDSCRDEDGYDECHGPRAATWIEDELSDTLLKDLTEEQKQLLADACRFHTEIRRTGNETIDICFDSDRLDLTRCGIVPDPNRMATKQGVEAAMQFWT